MLLHEFENGNRKATVYKEKGIYTVVMMQDEAIIQEVDVPDDREAYAEACAEDWVLGVTTLDRYRDDMPIEIIFTPDPEGANDN